MLLQLCGDLLASEPGKWSGPFDPGAYPLRRNEQDRERGLSAFLVAEALNQAGCRAANANSGGLTRYLPAVMRDFTLDQAGAERIAGTGGTLEARIVKEHPAVEVACVLKDGAGARVAGATIVVTAMTKVAA